MIEEVGPIGAVEPLSLTMAGALASRQGVARREKRLRWLKSLHAAQGGDAVRDEEEEARREREQEERVIADMRARLASAVSIVEALGSLSGGAGEIPSAPLHESITAAELARRMGSAAEQSLRAQARLGSDAVRQLVGWVR